MHACSGHGGQVEGLGSTSICRIRRVWGGRRSHPRVFRTEDARSGAGGALLVGRGRLGDLALQRSLLLSTQDVPDVVWRAWPSSSGTRCIGRHMAVVVRRASVGIQRGRVAVVVLREVVAPRRWMHGWIPVHPWASSSSLVVLQRIVGMPALSASSERRWRCRVKLHFRTQ